MYSSRSRSAPAPFYETVKQDICKKIAGGVWQPHDRIPSEAELVAQYGFSRMTINEIAARRHQHRCEVLTLERVRANAIQASALNVNESDVIFHSIMVHYENDLPVQIEDRCVNADIAVDYLTQDYRQTTPHAYLSRIAPLTEGEHIVEAVRATAQECAWLTIKEHEPCLLIRRTTWSASRIVSHARLLFPGSRYRLQGRFIS
ncbi:GntR family transcriptional regulator [Salmonella enterica subsp. enterica serovar Ouakam]|nr:GntR family transcriptional regulator [Salmonella enterica subsp. enterica serovar Ouakam]